MRKITIQGIVFRLFFAFVFLINAFVFLLILLAPLLKKKKRRIKLGLFPYAQKGSDGYQRRFVEYFPYLEKEGFTYKIFDVCSNEDFRKTVNSSSTKKYSFYLKNYFIRISQTLQIRNCERVFIQRNLIPYFFDQKNPVLEKLAFKLCNHVVIDYWDAVWVGNPKLIDKSIKNAHKLSVVNNYLKDYFLQKHSNIEIFSLGINTEKYIIKPEYNLVEYNTLTLVYTGLPEHVGEMMKILEDVWTNTSFDFNIKLIIISEKPAFSEKISIEHHLFDENTFFELLIKADVGIYAVNDNVYSRGKMAMKTLDYASAGLPQICAPYGLSPHMNENEHYLCAKTTKEWVEALKTLYENADLRKKIGVSGRNLVEKHHELSKSFLTFKSINKL